MGFICNSIDVLWEKSPVQCGMKQGEERGSGNEGLGRRKQCGWVSLLQIQAALENDSCGSSEISVP